MATLKTILGIGSEEYQVTSGKLLTSLTKDYTVTEGGIVTTEIDATTEGTAVKLLSACTHALGTKVYLRNLHATNTLKFKCTGGTNYEIVLTPGQFAFFPCTARCPEREDEDHATNLHMFVFASAVDTTLEYGTFI